MAEGVDYSFARPGGAALAAAGKQFALRYLWYNTASKGINQAEYNDLVSHGLAVGLIYEEDGLEWQGGYAAGVACAKKAEQYRTNNGFPALPIYFAVDTDASDFATINAFCQGAASVIGHGRTGLYGGVRVIEAAFNAGVIAYAMQTYAWSKGRWDGRAQVQQYSNGQNINGAVDYCRNMAADFGASSARAAGGTGSSAGPSGNITSRSTRDVQQALVSQGYDTGGVDGIYGAKTTAAVRAYQSKVGITADGIYGPVTDAHLFGVGLVVDGVYGLLTCKAEQSALGVGVDGVRGRQTISAEQRRTGAGVDGVDGPDTNRHLQTYLNARGFNAGKVDGVRGRQTISALQQALNAGKF